MDNRPIGFFDSGLGGLTCIPNLFNTLPNERVVYFGDTARTPYGSKAVSTIRHHAMQIAEFLVSMDVKMLVIACNTVSAVCIEDLRKRFPDIPVIGVIEPAAREVAATCGAESRVGVIGTKATIESGFYRKKIHELAPEIKVFDKATPLFVPLIEEGVEKNQIMDMAIRYHLDDFINENRIDTLVLGCTHYPIIRKNIMRIYPGLDIINPSYVVAGSIVETLKARDILADGKNGGQNVFYASDLSENFSNMIKRILEIEESDLILKFKNLDI